MSWDQGFKSLLAGLRDILGLREFDFFVSFAVARILTEFSESPIDFEGRRGF